jgi:predicted nucleic acid-binding Zn finger protein
MTTQELAKRTEKSQELKVWQVDETWFYVESEEGKICYKVCITEEGNYCSCGDFAKGSKNEPTYTCKHILSVMNSIPEGEAIHAKYLEKFKPRVDERFVKIIDDKEFVLYSGLLDLAHQKDLISMEVELLQYPSKDNDHTAICKAVAKTLTRGPYVDIGDANPMNCNSKVAKHLIRMASTRAKARSLRDLTNIGMTCLEELGDLNEVIGAENGNNGDHGKTKIVSFPNNKEEKVVAGNGSKPGGNGKTPAAMKPAPKAPVSEKKEEPGDQTHADAGNNQEITPTTTTDTKAIEETKPVDTTPKKKGNGKITADQIPKISDAQRNAIYNLSRRRGISMDELENMATEAFNMTVENLSLSEASSFIKTLQQSA